MVILLELNRVESSFMNHQGVLYSCNQAIAKRVMNLLYGAGSRYKVINCTDIKLTIISGDKIYTIISVIFA